MSFSRTSSNATNSYTANILKVSVPRAPVCTRCFCTCCVRTRESGWKNQGWVPSEKHRTELTLYLSNLLPLLFVFVLRCFPLVVVVVVVVLLLGAVLVFLQLQASVVHPPVAFQLEDILVPTQRPPTTQRRTTDAFRKRRLFHLAQEGKGGR